MLINNKEYDVDKLIKEVNVDTYIMYKDMYLSNNQISILNNNGFDYKKYNNIKELIFDVDEYLYNEPDNIELEKVLEELTEFDYYHNVNK